MYIAAICAYEPGNSGNENFLIGPTWACRLRSWHRSFSLLTAARDSSEQSRKTNMPPRLAESPLALVHRSLRVFADDQGLVICPTNDSPDRSTGSRPAVRLRWDTNVPQAIEWQALADQDGLEVHCLGGVLVGFERESSSLASSLEVTRTP